MYKVGLVDDFNEQYESYKKRLLRREIELIFADDCNNYQQILEWIFDNQIEYLLVDYQLDERYPFSGSQLVHYINNQIPDLPCIIFTSNPVEDDLVIKNLIKPKGVLDSDGTDYEEFIDNIKQGVKVFENRTESSVEEYRTLLNKERNEEEEEKFLNLYKRLCSYGYVEKVPNLLLSTSFEEKIDKLIEKLDKCIDKEQ
jgi:DNA-binding NtrC family response regulator